MALEIEEKSRQNVLPRVDLICFFFLCKPLVSPGFTNHPAGRITIPVFLLVCFYFSKQQVQKHSCSSHEDAKYTVAAWRWQEAEATQESSWKPPALKLGHFGTSKAWLAKDELGMSVQDQVKSLAMLAYSFISRWLAFFSPSSSYVCMACQQSHDLIQMSSSELWAFFPDLIFLIL